MSFFGAKPTLKPAVNESTAQDVEVPNGPTDSISAISFSPSADLLAVSSWDNQIRIYEIGQSINGKAAYSHEAPVLDVCWSRDGTKVLSGGVDNTARLFDLQTGTASQVAQHQAPIRCVRWIDMQNGLLATGSWDKTIKVSLLLSVPILERRPLSPVLGSPYTKSSGLCLARRALLCHGCLWVASRCRNCRTQDPDLQSTKSYSPVWPYNRQSFEVPN